MSWTKWLPPHEAIERVRYEGFSTFSLTMTAAGEVALWGLAIVLAIGTFVVGGCALMAFGEWYDSTWLGRKLNGS